MFTCIYMDINNNGIHTHFFNIYQWKIWIVIGICLPLWCSIQIEPNIFFKNLT